MEYHAFELNFTVEKNNPLESAFESYMQRKEHLENPNPLIDYSLPKETFLYPIALDIFCLLCEREFTSEEHLASHIKFSEMHRDNLTKWHFLDSEPHAEPLPNVSLQVYPILIPVFDRRRLA